MSENVVAVRCMLLPLTSLNLLLPNSAVAEIIGYSPPHKLVNTSDWFPGLVMWRGIYIPVITAEQMCDIDVAKIGARARIAIVFNPDPDPELPYLGIHIQDIPRAYLAESSTMKDGTDDGINPYLLSWIDDEQQARAIPNIDKIIEDLKLEFNQSRADELSR